MWLLVAHADVDWTWLVRHAKADDLQNRVGFLVSLAAEAAQREGQTEAHAQLTSARAVLERSRLAVEGAFRHGQPTARTPSRVRPGATPLA